MPKRKHREENISDIARKLRKLRKKLKKSKSRRKRVISSSSDDSMPAPNNQNDGVNRNQSTETINMEVDSIIMNNDAYTVNESNNTGDQLIENELVPSPNEVGHEPCLDSDILEILGEDPTTTVVYGKDIRPEVAKRFDHIATNGLDKELRKELCDKYIIPANCVLIGAPALNAEIKAALTDTVVKRDKQLQIRQKRIAAAISCIGETLTYALEAKEKDNSIIKRLMDVGRLLCDAQYNESVSRRNFAVYSLKREMKEHILNTKIDKSLFGENLSESLKAAKAVNKSGIELKTLAMSRNAKPTTPSKNWKPPAAGWVQRTTAQRGAPAAPPMQAGPPPPPPPPGPRARASSSKRPPPPPQTYTRRRY